MRLEIFIQEKLWLVLLGEKLKAYQFSKETKNNSNFPFWFSMLKESMEMINFRDVKTIVDFGFGNGGFTKLIAEAFSHIKITGIELDDKLIQKCNFENNKENISYINYNRLTKLSKIDVFFSQEVVYTQKTLINHAREIFNALRFGGYYIFTIGCHIENPTWARRRVNIRKTESYDIYDYSLEDIARSFFDAGFRVSVKKLPLYAPMKYVPREDGEFIGISEMLNSSENHKFIFFMLKPHK